MEISALLYSIIDEIGKERIQTDIASDIGFSRRYLEIIMNKCKERIEPADEETVGLLCEPLLHFMLTVCILPSVRKVVCNSTILDIVIPNLHTLKSSPEKSLIIQIAKESDSIIQAKVNNIRKFQPDKKNLWIVSEKPLSLPYINYSVNPQENAIPSPEKRVFFDLIVDIDRFLYEKGDKSLRIFQ